MTADIEIEDGRRRAVVEGVSPEIDGGRFPVKRAEGERMKVEADVFTDGHDAVSARLLWRRLPAGTRTADEAPGSEADWNELPMEPLGNDRWRGSFPVGEPGRVAYTVEGWVDHFKSWRRDLVKRVEAGQEVGVDLRIGAGLVREAAERAGGREERTLAGLADSLEDDSDGSEVRGAEHPRVRLALDPELAALVERHPDRGHVTRYPKQLVVQVDRELARFSAWYEMFPRSASPEPERHGTFADVVARLPYVAGMGFDVLYLPPIHPVGKVRRKGRNNAVTAEPGDVGSPWAIGSDEGGHEAVHPELGSLEDFRRLVVAAREAGLEIALDIAFQCAPDHPWVEEHPEWFRARPDGTIQYAENPPKKYQDIYPFDFESEDWEGLWHALKGVFEHWIEQGVTIFRVDNPHTKAFPFWEWAIGELTAERPDLVFLSEAFTRPKVMYRLAKLGFHQSYNYFPWRTTKAELTEYLTELTTTEVAEYLRPNLWPNTPDILTEQLQLGGRPVFAQRLVLAATLGASYGIYGPPFELFEGTPREPGSEEYLDSEKYQLRHWDLDRADSLSELVARVNRIRREHPALQANENLAFHPSDNDRILAYSKRSAPPEPIASGTLSGARPETAPSRGDTVLVVVNLDPAHTQSAWLHLDLHPLGLEVDQPFEVHDLLTGARYAWEGSSAYVELDPHEVPAHVFHVRSRRSERDFDYFD